MAGLSDIVKDGGAMPPALLTDGRWSIHQGDYRHVLPGIRPILFERRAAIVTDPPYRFATSGGGRYRKARAMLDTIGEKGLDLGFDLDLLSWRNAGSIVVFCHNDQLGDIIARLKQGFKRHCVCMVHKKNPQPVANRHYRPDTEFYVHAWQDDTFPVGTLDQKSRWMETGRAERFDHPTVKPLAVMQKIIANVQADLIFDPFTGTGTTGVAALLAGKRFIGCEIDAGYFEIARQRLAEAAALQDEAAP